MLETIEVASSAQPVKASVIWLHGLGADGYDFANIVPQLHLSPHLPVRFVFPHAPLRPVTMNHKMIMRSWFDVFALQIDAPIDEVGIRATALEIDALIQKEQQRGIPYDRILLAGFSQGGAVALYTGLRYPQTLGGIVGLSTFMPLADKLAQEASPMNNQIPIFLGHGIVDPVVSLKWAHLTRDVLIQMNYPVEWHQYPMLHQLCNTEITDIKKWIEQKLNASFT